MAVTHTMAGGLNISSPSHPSISTNQHKHTISQAQHNGQRRGLGRRGHPLGRPRPPRRRHGRAGGSQDQHLAAVGRVLDDPHHGLHGPSELQPPAHHHHRQYQNRVAPRPARNHQKPGGDASHLVVARLWRVWWLVFLLLLLEFKRRKNERIERVVFSFKFVFYPRSMRKRVVRISLMREIFFDSKGGSRY